MTTKEQEKKALEQIKKIIAGLGEGSYIAMAMDGMIEDAEENIENDFALSWKERAKIATKRYEKAEAELVKLAQSKDELRKKLMEDKNKEVEQRQYYAFEAQKQANRAAHFEEDLEGATKQIAELQAKLDSLKAESNEAIADKDNLLAQRDFEVMQLKAKLYDLMNR